MNLLTDDQKLAIRKAGTILNKAFPKESMQVCFNLSRKFDNVNFNIKKTDTFHIVQEGEFKSE